MKEFAAWSAKSFKKAKDTKKCVIKKKLNLKTIRIV